MSGIKLFEFKGHGNLVGFAANFYGLHCKNVTWITWVKRGIEINSQKVPKHFVCMTSKTCTCTCTYDKQNQIIQALPLY